SSGNRHRHWRRSRDPGAKAATTTIPIVFSTSADPVEIGLVASLNRPGGNVTGVTNLAVQIGPKQLEFLHELVPTASVAVLLVNPTNPTLAETQSRDLQAAARTLVVGCSTETGSDAGKVFLRASSGASSRRLRLSLSPLS